MNRAHGPSPARALLFFSTSLLLLSSVGVVLQVNFQLPGSILNELLLFLGLTVLFILVAERRPVNEVLRVRLLSGRGVLKSIVLGLASWALVQIIGTLALNLVVALGGKMYTSHQLLLQAPFPLALFAGALIPAICEEAAFRGYIQWGLGPLGASRAILMTGLLFGMMHFSLIKLIPLTVLGWIFAAAVQRTGSTLPGMIMHFVHNATALLLTFFYRGDALEAGAEGAPSLISVLVLVAAAATLSVAVWALLRRFGPEDLAAPSATFAATPSGETDPGFSAGQAARRSSALLLLPLVPAIGIYGLMVANEIYVVFFGP